MTVIARPNIDALCASPIDVSEFNALDVYMSISDVVVQSHRSQSRVPLDKSLLQDSAVLDVPIMDAIKENGADELATDEDSRCKYLSKPCDFARSRKVNGTLHNLCMFHRAKAIINQRRLELRKKGVANTDAKRGSRRRRMESSTECPPTMATSKKNTRRRKRNYSGAKVRPYPVMIKGEGEKQTLSPRGVSDFFDPRLEPFMSPVPLWPEDIEIVHDLMMDDAYGFIKRVDEVTSAPGTMVYV